MSIQSIARNIQLIAKVYCRVIQMGKMLLYAVHCFVTYYYSNSDDLFYEALKTQLQIINPPVILVKDHHLKYRLYHEF